MGTLWKSKEDDKELQTNGQVATEHQHPVVDITESDTMFTLEVELPGVKKDQVQIDLNGQILSVKAERMREKTKLVFERQFRIGERVVVDNIKASHENGLLTITIPKEPMAQPRQIQIES